MLLLGCGGGGVGARCPIHLQCEQYGNWGAETSLPHITSALSKGVVPQTLLEDLENANFSSFQFPRFSFFFFFWSHHDNSGEEEGERRKGIV